MRFKISQQSSSRHKKMVTCVTWNASDEIFSCGDDHQLLCWKFEGGILTCKVVIEFPDDFYPTDMQWHPRPSQPGLGALKKQTMDVLLITTDDGKFHLVNRSGRIEKSVAGHNGAILAGKWSYDGTALYTAGEDGQVKVWSRSGMLRSTVVRAGLPVHASAWSPDNGSVLYSQGPYLLVQSLATSAKPQRWHAHDGLVLVVSWNQFHGLIVSGGEDCRHKVWDANGNLLYASVTGEQPVTAVSWCFSGAYFAVGTFDCLKLCDKTGWPHSLEKLQAGSVYGIGWSSDCTQVALACSDGSVLVAHTVEKKLEYNNYEATLIKRKAVRVIELGSDVNEVLEIADRVVQLEFGYGHLVAVTPSQCHVYSVKNWNTPAIFDLKNGSVSAVLLAEKHFLLIEWNVLSLYNYQGRSMGLPKWKSMTMEPLYPPCVSICNDTLVLRDQTNHKLIHILEVSSKKPISEDQPYTHVQDVVTLALNQVGGVNDRQLALIDANRDLFLITVRLAGFGRVCKIATMAHNVAWATDANVLAGMLDSSLSVWLCPNCVHYSDRKIIRKTRVDRDSSEFGKHPTIVKVKDGQVTVRRGDGALVVSSFYTFLKNLHRYVLEEKWEEAVSLCRIVQNETLWTCMAVMAIDSKQLSIAEEACAAIGRYDKVDYIHYIKKIPNELSRLSETYALMGDLQSAEGLLLQNGLIAEAIKMNVTTYRWSRALELALKHKKLLDEVYEERRKYLKLLNKPESSREFIAAQYPNSSQAKKLEAREKEREAAREREREEKRIEREERRMEKEKEEMLREEEDQRMVKEWEMARRREEEEEMEREARREARSRDEAREERHEEVVQDREARRERSDRETRKERSAEKSEREGRRDRGEEVVASPKEEIRKERSEEKNERDGRRERAEEKLEREPRRERAEEKLEREPRRERAEEKTAERVVRKGRSVEKSEKPVRMASKERSVDRTAARARKERDEPAAAERKRRVEKRVEAKSEPKVQRNEERKERRKQATKEEAKPERKKEKREGNVKRDKPKTEERKGQVRQRRQGSNDRKSLTPDL